MEVDKRIGLGGGVEGEMITVQVMNLGSEKPVLIYIYILFSL